MTSDKLPPHTSPDMMLAAQHRDLYAYLKQRLVWLPEPYSPRGWVVDLRDPFHPVAECYDTWAAADTACSQRIMELLGEMVAHQKRTA